MHASGRPNEGPHAYQLPPHSHAQPYDAPYARQSYAEPLPRHSYEDAYAPALPRQTYGTSYSAPLAPHTYTTGSALPPAPSAFEAPYRALAPQQSYSQGYSAPQWETSGYGNGHASVYKAGYPIAPRLLPESAALAPVTSQTTVSVTPRHDLATWTWGESYATGPAMYSSSASGPYGGAGAAASLSRGYPAGYAAGSASVTNAAYGSGLTNAAFSPTRNAPAFHSGGMAPDAHYFPQ